MMDKQQMEAVMTTNMAVMTTGDELVQVQQSSVPMTTRSYFSSLEAFTTGQRMCQMLAASSLVPRDFQNNLPNVMIALEIANRTGSSPLAVMQNLYIVQGRPSWSSQFVIAALNSCGKFSPLRFAMQGEGDGQSCFAWALELATSERLEGPPVSIAMAKKEGWYGKNGSKWQTMPELMLRYRAAAFFGRLYAPEILMGMQANDEIDDIAANDAMMRERQQQSRPQQRKSSANVQQTPVQQAQKPARPAKQDQVQQAQTPPLQPQSGDMDSLLASAPPPERATQRQETNQTAATTAQEDGPTKQQSMGENPIAEYEAAVKRYKDDIDSKQSISELQWWPDRNRKAMERELDGKDSEWYLGVMEYHKEALEKLKARLK